MTKAVLGDYILDIEQQLLFRQSQELAVEPKAFALLLYLYQQRDRYVSLEELHQQVWADRVVSDSAIRSTIKKLRNLLDDNDLSQPRYIKSLPKRGFKLVCRVSSEPPLDSANIATHEAAGGIREHAAVLEQPAAASALPFKTISLVLSLLLGAVIIWFALLWQQEAPVPDSYFNDEWRNSAELISTIGGEKRGLALSPDGTYLAFIGRQNRSSPWQLYLMHGQTRNLQQLQVDIEQPFAIQFYDDKTLFVVDEVFGQSGVYRIDLDEQFELRQQERVLGFSIITGFNSGNKLNEWLISGFKTENSSSMLYKWNVELNTLGLVDLCWLLLQQFGWYLYKAEVVMCSYST